MITIAIVNLKGGCGKSTLAVSLSVAAATHGDPRFGRVALVDLDPQQSVAFWSQVREDKDRPTLMAGADSAVDAMEALEHTGWDVTFLDSGPAHIDDVAEIISVADVALVPVKPSAFDVAATLDTIKLAQEKGVPALVVINDVNQHVQAVADSIRDTLTMRGATVADTMVRNSVAHVRAIAVGKSAAEVDGGRHKNAKDDIQGLWLEVSKAAKRAKQRQGQ